jgi:hyperosmotically inducible periplasmic protein
MPRLQHIASVLLLSVLIACGGGAAISHTVDDATLTTRVKTSLLNEPGVAAQNINVQTTGGVVTLSGVVKSPDEEQHAISAARKVEGVRDVKSQLKVGGQRQTGN